MAQSQVPSFNGSQIAEDKSVSIGSKDVKRNGNAASAEEGSTTSNWDVATSSAREADDNSQDCEGVFEIRDFTTASDFERLTHCIALVVKKWGKALLNPVTSDLSLMLKAANTTEADGKRMFREEFDHADKKYELIFHLAASELDAAGELQNGNIAPIVMQKLGIQSFPSRTPRLQRLFGVQHFVVISIPEQQTLDLDVARTMLSALALASQGVALPCKLPMSCFVNIGGGGRHHQHLGELSLRGLRLAYSTDLSSTVEPGLEHLAGLSDFFWRKIAVRQQVAHHALVIGARFTYVAEAFDDLVNNSMKVTSSSTPTITDSEQRPPSSDKEDQPGQTGSKRADEDTKATAASDPVDIMQLYCLWPCFPAGSFTDNAVYSELDPHHAPYWRLRVMRVESRTAWARTAQLRNLLDFRREARTVKSAETSAMPQMPKTALGSLTYVFQESLESILLPSAGEMLQLLEECLSCAVVVDCEDETSTSCRGSSVLADLEGVQGALPGSRLAKIAAYGSDMKCFRGLVMLWFNVVAQMRKQWDELQCPKPGTLSPPTKRLGEDTRAECFSTPSCLVQQKFEMLQRSVEMQAQGKPGRADVQQTQLRLKGMDEPLIAPQLMPPSLLTEDMLVQRDLLRAQLTDPVELAELDGRELRADIAAFKDANPKAVLADFQAWRSEVEGLSSGPLPQDWLQECWTTTIPQHAVMQTRLLFDPEREAEMALHYLENIDGTQLLLQVFCVHLTSSILELNASLSRCCQVSLPYLLKLQEALCAQARDAFRANDRSPNAASPGSAGVLQGDVMGNEHQQQSAWVQLEEASAAFPEEASLEALMATMEEFEAAVHMAESLAEKLPGIDDAVINELLEHGEVAIGAPEHRRVVEELFTRSSALIKLRSRHLPDGKRVFEDLPFAKEFIFQLQPVEGICGPHRMYTEIRENHQRLAMARSFVTC